MGIFTPDFASVDASIPIFEKGLYRVKVTAKKPVVKEAKDDKGNIYENAFMQYNLEMQGRFNEQGELVNDGLDGLALMGRTVSPFKCYVRTEGGWKYSKSFIMAAAGYDVKKEEQKANAELFQSNDWTINGEATTPTENIIVGAGWDLPVNRLVDVVLTKKIETRDGREFENQDYGSWRPVK